jgi:hypothetical protein
MKTEELVWAMLPEGLEEYFDLESFTKTAEIFRITLIEKNTVPENLPPEYRRKRIVDSSLDQFTLNDFPIRGRKGEIVLKRRSWKFEGIDKWLRRELNLCSEGTKLEKEFAVFLKEFDRE